MAAGPNDAIESLVQAGFERHAAEVALASSDGNVDRAAAMILSWGGADPPPPPAQTPPPAVATGPMSAAALRLSAGTPAADAASGSGLGSGICSGSHGSGGFVPEVPPLPTIGPVTPSTRATEAEHRQRVFNKQREQEAKHKKQLRGEAKRRREQELAIWKEQRDDAKQRKGGGRSLGEEGGGTAAGGASPGGTSNTAGPREEQAVGQEGSDKPAAPAEAVVVMRLPDGSSAMHNFLTTASLREVVVWLQSNAPTAGKVRDKELELRCPFPLPGRAVAGQELDETTVDSVGLAPRGRIMVQFSGSTSIKQGQGAMPSRESRGGYRGRGRGARGPGGMGRGYHGRGRGRGFGRGGFPGGRGRGDPHGGGQEGGGGHDTGGGGDGDANDPYQMWAGMGGGGQGEEGVDEQGEGDQGEGDQEEEEEVGEVDGGINPGAGDEAHVDGMEMDDDDGEDDDQGDDEMEGAVDGMQGLALPPAGAGQGHVLGGGGAAADHAAVAAAPADGAMDADDNGTESAPALSSEERAAAVRQQRLARLTGRGGGGVGGGDGGGDDGNGDGDGAGGHGAGGGAGIGPKPADVGTLQDMLVDTICHRIKAGGHQASYGSLDGLTGGRILQRLIDRRALTPHMLAAFRGCPVASLTLDKNPRATNALLAELGRKVSLVSLSIAHDDMITLEGVESLVGLRSLSTLDISGCKANNHWLKAIAKLPALSTLIMRGCSKVADLGILGLSRGAPSLTDLDLTGCTGVTDAGIAHLSSVVSRLESLRLDGLHDLSDDGLDALCPFVSSSGGGDGSAASPSPQTSRLRLLSVSGCKRVTDIGLSRIVECMGGSLRELDISGTAVTERSLVVLAATGQGGRVRLSAIALPMHGRGVSRLGLGALVSMTSLTGLDIEGCNDPGVTSPALAGISRLQALRSLCVAMVPAFDDDALSAVCASCHALRELNVNGTAVSRAEGLALMGAGLVDLALAHTGVDDDTMDAVASLPGLTTLTLRGTKVTGTGISRLSSLTTLRSLNLAGTPAARDGVGGSPGLFVEALRRSSTAGINIRL